MSKITFEFATQDDCLDKMVPSDLRKLVKERDHAIALLDKHGICSDCGEMFSHWVEEPFASCNCKQSEWGGGGLTPYMQLEFRNNENCKKLGHRISDLEGAVKAANKTNISLSARRNILFSLIIQYMSTGELSGNDWDYISETEVEQLKEAIKDIKVSAINDLKFPTMLRKMWSGGDVQEWLKNQSKLIGDSYEEQTQTTVS